MMVDAVSREAELEEVTDALLLTGNDDFNALAAAELGLELGRDRVFRVAPDVEEMDLLAPPGDEAILGDPSLTSVELARRLDAGARFVQTAVDGRASAASSPGEVPLFVVTAAGVLRIAVRGVSPSAAAGDTVIALAEQG
jgi:hypothetical protein